MNSEKKRIILQVALFVITFITTTIAGAEWAYGKPILGIFFGMKYTWSDFVSGMAFSIPLLLFLTFHEFGHYFTAIYHKVKTSLPYYIPFPPGITMTIGTLGAVIRLRSKPATNIQSFDIGIAGPLSGFVVALMILVYGFITLPPPEYIYEIHPEYKEYGLDYAKHVYNAEFYKHATDTIPEARRPKQVEDVMIGSNVLYTFLSKIADPARVPNPHEMMHYPVLMAGFLALFFTSLNLLPIGQLDGGHVVYGLFGYKKHKIIASVFLVTLLLYGGLGLEYINPRLPINELVLYSLAYILFLYLALTGLQLSKRDTAMYAVVIFALHFLMLEFFPGIKGNESWLVFGFISGRFIGVKYPQSEIEQPLDSVRVALGWTALLIFVICFSLAPLEIFAIKL